MDAQRLLRRVACPTTTAAAMQSLAAPSTTAAAAAAASRRRIWTGAACSLLSQTQPLAPALIPQHSSCPGDRRYKSTANRTKRALNIAPHASFLPGGGGGGGSGRKTAEQATVLGTVGGPSNSATLLYNPPASAPSVYQTPFKFLPKSDPRRRSNLTTLFQAAAPSPTTTSSSSSELLPPELPHRGYAPPPARYHLTEADVAEMRRLRAEDPLEWSVLALARRFSCSPIFVMLAVRSSRQHRERRQRELAAVRARWGGIRTAARADRAKRREMLYSGEL